MNKDIIKLPDKRVIIAKNKQNIDVYTRRHVLQKVKQAVNSTKENIQKDILARLSPASINSYMGQTFRCRSFSSTNRNDIKILETYK